MRNVILQEILDFGYDKSEFSILNSIDQEKYHLYKESNFYQVFFLDERGSKQHYKSFSDINLAKEYLIDLFRIQNGLSAFYRTISNHSEFERRKSDLIQLLRTGNDSGEKKKIGSGITDLIKKTGFEKRRELTELKEFYFQNAILIDENIRIEIEFFINGLKSD
ncbi:hypothetical protein [Luteirhabdus pelagi]|uniref:hypothetical protein n=1 Tax=Luteirhabdus pelagi TaxID=2792783 RepID=UPI0019397044|nr:hypothetical protein [Luteirhabdus pelagi]